jgi:hypothetical protein
MRRKWPLYFVNGIAVDQEKAVQGQFILLLAHPHGAGREDNARF